MAVREMNPNRQGLELLEANGGPYVAGPFIMEDGEPAEGETSVYDIRYEMDPGVRSELGRWVDGWWKIVPATDSEREHSQEHAERAAVIMNRNWRIIRDSINPPRPLPIEHETSLVAVHAETYSQLWTGVRLLKELFDTNGKTASMMAPEELRLWTAAKGVLDLLYPEKSDG